MMYKDYQDYLIRDWQPSDRDAASHVIHQVLLEYGLPWQPEIADRDVMEIESAYLEVGGEFWVIESSTKIIGTAAYYPIAEREKAVEIRKMYLLPEARGRGLGKYLLYELETAIQNRGFELILLETASVLQEAVILYEKYGYKPTQDVNTARCDLAYYKNIAQLKN